jgi:hypothetical protein
MTLTTPVSTDPIGTYAADLLQMAGAALQASPYVDLPARAALYPGANVAWDNCCEPGGQLWVRIQDVFPSNNLLDTTPRSSTGSPCPQLWGVTYGVGIVRCVASIDDEANPPSALHLTTDTLSMTADASCLLNMLIADFLPSLEFPARVERGDPLGPDGGCAGWEWMVICSYNCDPHPNDPTAEPLPLF